MSTDATTQSSTPRTGRPRALNNTKLREICALVSRGCGIKEAARYVGCAPSTICRERQSNAAFRHKLARAKMKANLAPLCAMQRAMATNWRAAAWMLERTHPDRFGRRNHRAFTQNQARALIKDLTSIVGEEVASKIVFDRLSSRIEAAVRYALHAHNDTQRTGPELGRAMRHHQEKSPRYSSSLGQFPSVFPAAPTDFRTPSPPPSSSPTIAARATAAPRPAGNPQPATPKPQPTPSQNTASLKQQHVPPPNTSSPTGRALAQQIVDFIEPHHAAQPNASPLPTAPPSPDQWPQQSHAPRANGYT